MQSKTSFFNGTFFKKNLSRTWVVGLVWLLVQIYMIPMSYMLNLGSDSSARNSLTAPYNLIMTINNNSTTMLAAFFVIAVFMLNFSFLYNKRDSYMVHAFPLSRKALFFTGIASAMLVLIVPILLNGVITTAVAVATGASYISAVWYYCLTNIVAVLIESGIALFTLMISGQAITTVIFFFIFNYLYTAIEYVFRYLATYLMFGMDNAISEMENNIFTPMLYMARHCAVDFSMDWDNSGNAIKTLTVSYLGAGTMVIYLLAAIALAALAYLMYQKKQLETVHEFITVPVMKWIFAIGMSFFISLYLGTFAVSLVRYAFNSSYAMLFALATLVTLVAGAIIYFITQMLIAKNIRIFNRKNLAICGIYSAAVLVFMLAVNFDLAGIESRVPDESKVEWAGISSSYNQVYTDQDNIKRLIAAHEAIIADKADIKQMAYGNGDFKMVTIKYKLKSGKLMSRSYMLKDPETASASELYSQTMDTLFAVTNDPDNIKEHIIGNIWNDCQVVNMDFTLANFDENNGYSYQDSTLNNLSEEERSQAYQAVYQAFLKDIDAGVVLTENFDMYNQDSYYNDFTFVIRNDQVDYISDDSLFYGYSNDQTHETNLFISLTPDCTNTLAALKEYGFYTSDDQLVLYSTVNAWDDANMY